MSGYYSTKHLYNIITKYGDKWIKSPWSFPIELARHAASIQRKYGRATMVRPVGWYEEAIK